MAIIKKSYRDSLEEIRQMMSDRSVLVTGGAGFIGSHLVESLVGLGAKVIVVDNFSSGKLENLDAALGRCKTIEGDIRDINTFEGIGKVDIIFNEAAMPLIPSFKDPTSDLYTNAGGLLNVLETARRWDAKLIQASTGSVYGNPIRIPIREDHPVNPISPYGVSKLAAELYCRLYVELYSMDVCCLRYFNVYGPRQIVGEETGVIPIFVSRTLDNKTLTIFGDGRQSRDFVHVSDVVKANLLAATSKDSRGLIANIGGSGNEISILDLAYFVMKLLDKKLSIVFKAPKKGDISRLVADISRARSLLGYRPEVDLEEGLRDYIRYRKLQLSKSQGISL